MNYLFTKFSNALAMVFHPVFLFFYLLLFISLYTGEINYNLLIPAFSITVIIPLLVVFMLNKDDLFLRQQKRRTLPMIVTSLCYILFLFIYNYHKPFYAWRVIHDDLLLFIWGIILGSICVIIINLSFKISLHASSLTGLTINFLLLYTLQKDQLFLVLFLAFIPLTAIIIYQRLAGNFHTRQQVIAGVGLSCVIASITIGYYFLRMQ